MARLRMLLGIVHGMVLVKLDVDDVVLLHLGDGVGGDQFGVEALGHIGQVLEHALDVHHHGITGTGDDGQLLLQEIACRRYAVALKNLIGRTADAAQLDAFGALYFGVVRCISWVLAEAATIISESTGSWP